MAKGVLGNEVTDFLVPDGPKGDGSTVSLSLFLRLSLSLSSFFFLLFSLSVETLAVVNVHCLQSYRGPWMALGSFTVKSSLLFY